MWLPVIPPITDTVNRISAVKIRAMADQGLPQRQAGQRRRRKQIDALGGAADQSNSFPPLLPGQVDSGRLGPGDAPAQLDELRSQAAAGHNFEYLDHTADVQLHAWGKKLEEAFADVALAMYNYMTPIAQYSEEQQEDREFAAEAHDMDSLLFNFLDELLYGFCTDLFVCTEVQVTSLDREAWTLKAKGRGAIFDRAKHQQGTEVKAITYSAMQILEREGDAEVFVIVDI